MLEKFLKPEIIYIQIMVERFIIKNISYAKTVEVNRNQQNSSPRLLIANFHEAYRSLKPAVSSLKKHYRKPSILIQPIANLYGGITPVEYRIFGELATALGGNKIAIYYGEIPEENQIPQLINTLSDKWGNGDSSW